MATATRPKVRRPAWLLLREERTRGFDALPASGQRVDHEAGIIFGVKVLSADSPNNHQSGSTRGTVYTAEARQKLAPVLEGMHVNVDHPSRQNPGEDRSSDDGLGELRNVRATPDGVFADLHCLKTHPMWERVAEAAEKMPGAFALSINAHGKGEVVEGRYIVHEIAHVQSVDLVRDGGSNSTLFESGEHPVILSIRKLFEAARPAVKVTKRPKLAARWKRLFEDDELGMMDAESPMGETEAPADPTEALGDGFLAFCTAIIEKCIKGGEDPKQCAKEIASHLKTHAGMVGGDTEDEDIEESDEEEEGGEDDMAKKDADKAKEMSESKKRVTRLAKGFLALRESEAPPPKLIEALVALPTEEARLSLLESWPRGGSGADRGRAPVGVGPEGGRGGSGKLSLKDVVRAVRS